MAPQIKLGKERFYNTQFLTIGTCYLPKQLKSSDFFFYIWKTITDNNRGTRS